jgi:hypothetical protein
MTNEEINIAIANACGQGHHHLRNLPDYLNDLNAMNEAEKVLNKPERMQKHAFNNYAYLLIGMCKHQCNAIHATAAQRAEAFLRTLNLWKE